jgi:hypothetical protein
MSNDLAFAIKKDVRNNPVFREADRRQKREFVRRLAWFILAVAAVIFSVRQQNAIRLAGYDIERLSAELQREQAMNRQLQLNLETLEAPRKVEDRAAALGFRPPTLEETLVIERVPDSNPPGAVVARAR